MWQTDRVDVGVGGDITGKDVSRNEVEETDVGPTFVLMGRGEEEEKVQ